MIESEWRLKAVGTNRNLTVTDDGLGGCDAINRDDTRELPGIALFLSRAAASAPGLDES